MKRILFLCLLAFSSAVLGAERTIELNDGSRIRGEVISLSNGIYTIRTDVLGVIRVSESRVVSIGSERALQDKNTTVTGGDAVQSIQSSIASNPGLISKILQLQSDPEMQAVLSDPEVMRAVQQFDFEALSRNPKIQALMKNPTVKEINSGLQ
jgi:hypothetical protein